MPDLVDTFSRYGVSFKRHGEHHHASRGWVSVDCPWCSHNLGRYRLGFELNSSRVNCWNCGRVNGVEALSLLLRVSTSDAISIWKGLNRRMPTEAPPDRGTLKKPKGIRELLQPHKKYLRGRGFTDEQILQIQGVWGVKGIGLAARLQWRLWIPVHDERGEIVSWTTRSISSKRSDRYITASADEEAVSIKSVLYGGHLARNAVVIVEGPVDAWAIGPGAVSTCGVAFTDVQMSLMSGYSIRVVCFDVQKDAQRRAERLCKQLSTMPGTTENVLLETGSDPAEADPVEIQDLRLAYLEG